MPAAKVTAGIAATVPQTTAAVKDVLMIIFLSFILFHSFRFFRNPIPFLAVFMMIAFAVLLMFLRFSHLTIDILVLKGRKEKVNN